MATNSEKLDKILEAQTNVLVDIAVLKAGHENLETMITKTYDQTKATNGRVTENEKSIAKIKTWGSAAVLFVSSSVSFLGKYL